jgi:DNA-binding MarR family transcriptional regulator
MSKKTIRTANLLGATVLSLHDELRNAVEQQAGRAGEGPSAIVVVGHQPGISNDELSRRLALSHTGTVRLVDKLVADGLMERRPAPHDGRSIALYLSKLGQNERAQILAAREAAMTQIVARLDASEQATLQTLLGKILQTHAHDDEHKLRMCRLCDGNACGGKRCPIHVSVTENNLQ